MNETMKTIYSLQTIHGNFSKRNISSEDLKTIADACVQAANASARQSYSVIVVEDRKKVREQFDYAGSKALLFCVDFNRIRATAEHLGTEYHSEGIISFITGSIDTILAAQTASIAAKSLGIDSMFTNSIHRRSLRSVYEAFDLPATLCFPLIALILGYPETEPAYQKGRINGNGVIHYGRYQGLDEAGMNELVRLYDDPAKHLGLIENWEEKGFSHYLDWFYKVWCVGENIEKQKEFYSVLNQSQFINADMMKDIVGGRW